PPHGRPNSRRRRPDDSCYYGHLTVLSRGTPGATSAPDTYSKGEARSAWPSEGESSPPPDDNSPQEMTMRRTAAYASLSSGLILSALFALGCGSDDSPTETADGVGGK